MNATTKTKIVFTVDFSEAEAEIIRDLLQNSFISTEAIKVQQVRKSLFTQLSQLIEANNNVD